jgi:hypothetical protein
MQLYSAFHQSNLQVEKAEIINGAATVYLTGQLSLGGVCDSPRVKAQLEKTALQFSTVKSVKFFVNNKPLEQLLSEKGE